MVSVKNNAQNLPKFARKSAWTRIRESWQIYVIMLLPIAWTLIFCYTPMYGLVLAFKRYSIRLGIMDSPWVGWSHFETFFNSRISLQIIVNTLILSLYNIAASFLPPIILAVCLNEVRSGKFKKVVQMVTYAPYFISMVVMVGMMMVLLETRVGIVNRLLGLVGVGPINFMGKPSLFRHVYVWSGVWQTTGYSCIVYIAALAGISPELQEAAQIDGATKLQRIWHVDLPCIRPTIIIILIMSFGQVMNIGFEKVFLMQNEMNTATSEIISTYTYKIGLKSNNYGLATAIGLMNSIINLVLLLTANFIGKKVGDTGLW